jgi:hypothetical protein
MFAVIVCSKGQAYLLKCSFSGSGIFHVELREESQAKFEEWELSASTGVCAIIVHPDSKVELEKCLMKNELRTPAHDGTKSETTVSN